MTGFLHCYSIVKCSVVATWKSEIGKVLKSLISTSCFFVNTLYVNWVHKDKNKTGSNPKNTLEVLS